MCKYEMDLASIVEDTERTWFRPQTDRRLDRRTGCNQYTPFQLPWSGGIKNKRPVGLYSSTAHSNHDDQSMKTIPIALNWPDSNCPDSDFWIPWIAFIPIAANCPESNWPESNCPKCDCTSSNCFSSNCPKLPWFWLPKIEETPIALPWSPNRIGSACHCWGDCETVYSKAWLLMLWDEMGDQWCAPFFIVRRAGLLWSQQDFEWRWSVPLFKCLTVLEFSFILFDLCLLITFFNFIMNYVPIVTFWIFTYHKIWILSIMFCFIWSYWIIYFLACLEVSWRVVS